MQQKQKKQKSEQVKKREMKRSPKVFLINA
jgi:hypothetical protein